MLWSGHTYRAESAIEDGKLISLDDVVDEYVETMSPFWKETGSTPKGQTLYLLKMAVIAMQTGGPDRLAEEYGDMAVIAEYQKARKSKR